MAEAKLSEQLHEADWKKEKHVPVIECPQQVAADEPFEVKITLGKEIAHPNTTEHHIRWIALYFLPAGAKFTYEIGTFRFSAHGESAEGANAGGVYTHHEVTASMKTSKPGTLMAEAYCNIHGLWQSSKKLGLG